MSSYVKTGILLACLSAILLLIGEALGGQQGLIVAFGFAVIMNFGSYWFSDRIVLRMYRAQPVDQNHPLHQIVERLAQRARLPMPKVFIIRSDAANAFATGRNPEHASVAATEGILRLLSEDELAGVMAHELSHVANRDILIQTVAATVGAAIMMLARMAQFAALFGGQRDSDRGANPIALLATIIVAPLAAMLVQAAISRTREFAADESGARMLGTGQPLANALRKIEASIARRPLAANPATAHLFIMQPFAGVGGVMKLFSTHPPTDERVRRLMRI